MGKYLVAYSDRRLYPLWSPLTSDKIPHWDTSRQPLSWYIPSSSYGPVVNRERQAQQSSGETPLESTGVWVIRHMMMGASPTPSGFGTWCQWGLVVPLGVRSWGRRGSISGTPHGSGLSISAAVHIMERGWKKIFSGTWYPLYQIDDNLTQGCNHIYKATIFPVRPATTSSCWGSAAIVWNGQEGWPDQSMPGNLPPVGSVGSEDSQCSRSRPPWRSGPPPQETVERLLKTQKMTNSGRG